MTGGVAAFVGALSPRAPHRQVRPRRQAPGHPRPQHPVRHPRLLHPPGRLVRLQPRLRARRRRRHRRHRRHHDGCRGRWARSPRWLTIWIKTGKPDVAMTGNGLLAGLVGITAGTRRGHAAGRADHRWRSPACIVVFAVDFFDRVSRSTTRSARSRCTACAVRSARSASACSPARTPRLLEAGPLLRRRRRPARQPAHRRRRRRRLGRRSPPIILFAAIKATIGLRVIRGGGARRSRRPRARLARLRRGLRLVHARPRRGRRQGDPGRSAAPSKTSV